MSRPTTSRPIQARTGASRRRAPETETAEKSARPDNSLARLLGLLDFFTAEEPNWSAEALISRTGASRATIFRHVRLLVDAGLLRRVASGNYIIGPRVIELDRQLRHTDPLYLAGDGVMRDLVASTGHSVLLCALFSDSVMCVREELAEDSPPNLLSRGQRRPLFAGAASKVMLAYLPPHQMRSAFAKNREVIAAAGLGSDWTEFRSALARIREAGYVTTVGEFNPGVAGLSAPLFNRGGHILGSLGIAGAKSRFRKADMPGLIADVVAAAGIVTERISAIDSDLDFSPRAIG